jgi:leader peptidase (prepilin peptidase)/N-methyltransferase
MNVSDVLLYLLSGISGAILGSFFNVMIWRIPRGESVAWPPSHCPCCARVIPWYENIPVVSYLFLAGSCAGCKGRISPQYPLVELFTACCALFFWHETIRPFLAQPHYWWEYLVLFFQVLSLLILIPVSIIDTYHYIIPDSLSLGGLIAGFLISFVPGNVSPVESIMGIATGGGTLFAVGYIGSLVTKKEAMGGGDIKLMACIGSIWGWQIALYTIVFGAFAGTIVGFPLLKLKLLPKDHRIPFGPFLAFGAWIAVFAGNSIIQWYFRMIETMYR